MTIQFLWLPDTPNNFSGYGLEVGPLELVGLLMVDRPQPVSEVWLQEVTDRFGSYDLYPTTKTLERGIACCMFVDRDSAKFLRDDWHVGGLEDFLRILERNRPRPQFNVCYDDALKLWTSEFRIGA